MRIKIRKWSHAELFSVKINEVEPEQLKGMGLEEGLQLGNGGATEIEVEKVIFEG
jgi:hypothetical protein